MYICDKQFWGHIHLQVLATSLVKYLQPLGGALANFLGDILASFGVGPVNFLWGSLASLASGLPNFLGFSLAMVEANTTSLVPVTVLLATLAPISSHSGQILNYLRKRFQWWPLPSCRDAMLVHIKICGYWLRLQYRTGLSDLKENQPKTSWQKLDGYFTV